MTLFLRNREMGFFAWDIRIISRHISITVELQRMARVPVTSRAEYLKLWALSK
jgi:hypothetical protein